MNCDDRIDQISALLDGELPAAEVAALTAHIALCPECARVLAELGDLRGALAEAVPEEPVSADFTARIERALEMEADRPEADRPEARRPEADQPEAHQAAKVIPFRPRRVRLMTGGFGAGLAAAAVVMLLLWPHHDNTVDLAAVRDAALRGTMTAMSNSTGSAPAVGGFSLVSMRMDVIAGHRAQVAVYGQGSARVTLCIWPAGHEPAHAVRTATYRGTVIRYWNDGVREFWATSPSPQTLGAFVSAALRV
jgi:anti-sigma factor RsiW